MSYGTGEFQRPKHRKSSARFHSITSPIISTESSKRIYHPDDDDDDDDDDHYRRCVSALDHQRMYVQGPNFQVLFPGFVTKSSKRLSFFMFGYSSKLNF